MKAKGTVLALLLVFLFANTAYAQEMRLINSYASIAFSGSTAKCYVDIVGDSGSDEISATIELRCGSQSIKTWTDYADNGHLSFSGTASVTKGSTYELVVEYTVNGKAQTSFSASGTCM